MSQCTPLFDYCMCCITQKKWYKLNGVFNYIQLICKKYVKEEPLSPKRSFEIIEKDGVIFSSIFLSIQVIHFMYQLLLQNYIRTIPL
jgi:hypothetical protein